MWSSDLDADWQRLTAQALAEMKNWRAAHPRATLREIEVEVDRRLATARARLLEATALASPAAAPLASGERPPCPACGTPMEGAGHHLRRLSTTQQQDLALSRQYARCPRCGTGLFPPG